MPNQHDTCDIAITATISHGHTVAHIVARSIQALAFLGELMGTHAHQDGNRFTCCSCEAEGILEDCLMYSGCSVSFNGEPMCLGSDYAVHARSEFAA